MDLEEAQAGGNLRTWPFAIIMQKGMISWFLISAPILLVFFKQQPNVKTITVVGPGTILLPAR